MTKTTHPLLDTLQMIKGVGNLHTSGTSSFVFPKLQIEGIAEEIAFPITSGQISALLGAAHDAPFGKGSMTVHDKKVRSVKEIDATHVSFGNPKWDTQIADIVGKVKKGLGLAPNYVVTPELYKLLVYQPGDFFVPHKDSEKAPGMFGTLVVCLPSEYSGGELCFHIGDKKEVVDLAPSAADYQLGYCAFYADVTHEVLPLLTGHRICLVYNLVQKSSAQIKNEPPALQKIGLLTDQLRSLEKSKPAYPQIILLKHQYTPENFSSQALKLHDRAQYEAFSTAAIDAGWYTRLALVTYHINGSLEGGDHYDDYFDGGRRRSGRHQPTPETMGEIYDTDLSLGNWAEDGLPTLGDYDFEEEQIIADFELGEGKPIDKDAEGFTGNAGMTLDYWYHYGAIVFWPKSEHGEVLSELDTTEILEWMHYYTHPTNDETQKEAEKHLPYLLQALASTDFDDTSSWQYRDMDFTPLCDTLVVLKDKKYHTESAIGLLAKMFALIKADSWFQLTKTLPHATMLKVVETAFERKKLSVSERICALLLQDVSAENKLFADIRKRLPEAIAQTKLVTSPPQPKKLVPPSDEKITRKVQIVEYALALTEQHKQQKDWCDQMFRSLTMGASRHYTNHILAHVILPLARRKQLSPFGRRLFDFCIIEIDERAKQEPRPPKNWTIKIEKSKYGAPREVELLNAFLQSPTQQTFDYARVQSDRSTMESHVRDCQYDLTMETIKKGSPHTLRLTKNRASYQYAHNEWKNDVALYEALTSAGK
jgi:2OG-Fe(II) oxygenase superfamily